MWSKILPNADQPSAAPVLWRTVTSVADIRALGRGKTDAEGEAARRLEQARREAYTEGIAAGRDEAEQQIRPALAGIAQTISDLSRMRETIRQETTHDLVRLAVSIAARVIHRDVAVDPDALAGLVTAAFSKLQSREIHRVRMHPGMEALVQKCLEQCGAPKNLILAADTGLHPGELFFETSQGALDASVDTQLREIERGLIDRLER
jgi:flagellar assembly protein FliH